MKNLFLFLALVVFSPALKAEYRVYQYAVTSMDFARLSPRTTLVTSTLDPVSYTAYHGGSDSIKAELLRTWMCPGFTDAKTETCLAPGDADLSQKPTERP